MGRECPYCLKELPLMAKPGEHWCPTMPPKFVVEAPKKRRKKKK